MKENMFIQAMSIAPDKLVDITVARVGVFGQTSHSQTRKMVLLAKSATQELSLLGQALQLGIR